MKRALLYFFIFIYQCAFAQIDPYSTYLRNWQIINPAAVHNFFYDEKNSPNFCLHGQGNFQWIGSKNAPRNTFASFEGFFDKENRKNRFGLGAIFDKSGAFNHNSFFLNYKYIAYLKNGTIYSGIGIRTDISTFDFNSIKNSNDFFLTETTSYGANKNGHASFGIFYRHSNVSGAGKHKKTIKPYIGLSITNLLSVHFNPIAESKFQWNSNTARVSPNFYLIGGCWMKFGADERVPFYEIYSILRSTTGQSFSSISPNFHSPLSLDAGVRVGKTGSVFGGLRYGSNQLLGMELGFNGNRQRYNPYQVTMTWSVPFGNRFVRFGSSVELAASYFW